MNGLNIVWQIQDKNNGFHGQQGELVVDKKVWKGGFLMEQYYCGEQHGAEQGVFMVN